MAFVCGVRDSNHPEHSPAVSMGVMSDGNPFGVPDGLFCSFPVRCTVGGEWVYDEGFHLNDDARRHLEASVAVSHGVWLAVVVLACEGDAFSASNPNVQHMT